MEHCTYTYSYTIFSIPLKGPFGCNIQSIMILSEYASQIPDPVTVVVHLVTGILHSAPLGETVGKI